MTSRPASIPRSGDLDASSAAGSRQRDARLSEVRHFSSDGGEHTTVRPDPDMLIVRTRKKTRKRHRHRRRGPRGLRVVAIVCIVLVAVVVVGAVAAGLAVRMGDQNLHAAADSVEDSAKTVRYDGHTYQFNDNVVSVVVLGIDDESGYAVRSDAACADTNMLVTMDTQTLKTNIAFIPRDTMVDMNWEEASGSEKLINAQLATAYSIGRADEAKSAENSMRSVSRIFYNLPINQYFVFTPESVKSITNAVGGVPLTAEIDDPSGAFSAGDEVLLQGESAWRYLKWRSTAQDASAEQRLERQERFVQAFLVKAASLPAADLLNLYTSVQKTTHTNLGAADIAYLISCFVQGGSAKLSYTVLDGTIELAEDSDGVEREHVYLDEDKTMKATLAAFYTQVD